MSTVVYVVSNQSETVSRYKIGFHTGSLSQLKSRYMTAIPDVKVHYFMETVHAKNVESKFKTKHSAQRVINSNGNKSEWFSMSLDEVYVSLSELIIECHSITQPRPVFTAKTCTDRSSECYKESVFDVASIMFMSDDPKYRDPEWLDQIKTKAISNERDNTINTMLVDVIDELYNWIRSCNEVGSIAYLDSDRHIHIKESSL